MAGEQGAEEAAGSEASEAAGEEAKSGNETILGGSGEEAKVEDQAGEGEEAKAGEEAEGEGEGEGEKKSEEDDKPELVTAETEFEIPEGTTVSDEDMSQFREVSEKLGLNKEQAQGLLNMEAGRIARMNEAMVEAQEKQSAEWAEASKSDKEFGGEKFGENVAIAKIAMDKFAGDDVKEMLDATGLGNHPGFIRMFLNVGKAIGGDGFVGGGTGGGEPVDPESKAAAFYAANRSG